MPGRRPPNLHADDSTAAEGPVRPKSLFCFILAVCIFFAVWLILSGKFDLFHVALGIAAGVLVAFYSRDLMFAGSAVCPLSMVWLRFIGYLPWLFYQILRANLRILYLVFHPRMMDLIDPVIIEFKSRLSSELALTTFANSITLTPGTITVFVSIYGDFKVHAIDRLSGAALPGEMEKRIACVFGE